MEGEKNHVYAHVKVAARDIEEYPTGPASNSHFESLGLTD